MFDLILATCIVTTCATTHRFATMEMCQHAGIHSGQSFTCKPSTVAKLPELPMFKFKATWVEHRGDVFSHEVVTWYSRSMCEGSGKVYAESIAQRPNVKSVTFKCVPVSSAT